MSHVTSKDGTTIASERSGTGPALILVDGALCSRAFGPSPKLAPRMVARPADITTRRYMVLRKATPSTEAGEAPPAKRAALARLIDETTRSGVHVVSETMRPGRRGKGVTRIPATASVFTTGSSWRPRN